MKNVNFSENFFEYPWENVDIDVWIMYISCLSSLTQSCEMSIFLHEAKPSNQFSLKEKHVNHDLVLKFNKTKKGYFCLKDVDNSNSNDASLYSDILQKFSFSFYSQKIKK